MLCFKLPIDLRTVSSFTRKRKLKTIGVQFGARINNSGGRRRRNTRNILAKSRRMTAIRCPRDQKPWINPYTHASSDLNPRELVARCWKWRIVRVIDNPARIAPAKLFSVGEKPIPVVFALVYPLGKLVFFFPFYRPLREDRELYVKTRLWSSGFAADRSRIFDVASY